MSAYYNENDPFAASWLRALIKAGLIANGEVDERSIVDVSADDVRGFVQCHFFAGIGGWSLALRLAGWPDDSPVWTGSCPCQPFSYAGAQAGGHDSRDLWPAWFKFVRECRPVVIFGEQVEAAIRHGWFDRVCDDLEAEGYAVGACGLPGPVVGAFDIRARLWFVADRDDGGRTKLAASRLHDQGQSGDDANGCGHDDDMADTDDEGSQRRGRAKLRERADQQFARPNGPSDRRVGFWADAEWIACSDGKARPVEPGTFPLAHGIPARVGRLRGYGNAIKPQVAQAFIEAYREARALR